MPKTDIPSLIPGDHVRYGSRSGTVKWSYPRKSDGKKFLMVLPADGPAEFAWKHAWEPLIHWTDDLVPTTRCSECEREFRPVTDEHGLKRIFCRTCDRAQTRTDQTMVATAESRSRYDSLNWKSEHRPHRGRKF